MTPFVLLLYVLLVLTCCCPHRQRRYFFFVFCMVYVAVCASSLNDFVRRVRCLYASSLNDIVRPIVVCASCINVSVSTSSTSIFFLLLYVIFQQAFLVLKPSRTVPLKKRSSPLQIFCCTGTVLLGFSTKKACWKIT